VFGEPFKYQVEFLNSETKRISFRSGRQVGKTTICAMKAIHHALNRDKAVVVILSPTQRQSSLMFRKVRAYTQHYMIKLEVTNESQTMLGFQNGSEIHSLPGNNPDTIRGFSPTMLIIDEAAFVKDEVYVAAEPSLAATNGQLILVSTPFGKRGRFYQAFQEDVFEKYHIKSVNSPLITEEFLEGMKGSKTELEYMQEFEGEFLEEQDTYFGRDLVLSGIAEIEDIKGPRDKKDYFLGVDVARYGLDETVYMIAELDVHGNIQIIDIINTSKKPLTDVIGRVKELDKTWHFRAIYIDESGLGGGAVDSLVEKHTNIKNLDNQTGGVQFTLDNKEKIYKNIKFLLEQGRLKYPKHDKLILQLADLQYEFTEAGHLKLGHPDNGHDDFPDALALACAGTLKKFYKPYIAM